jgi:hypothetical protein
LDSLVKAVIELLGEWHGSKDVSLSARSFANVCQEHLCPARRHRFHVAPPSNSGW